jgi:hypothetical protein
MSLFCQQQRLTLPLSYRSLSDQKADPNQHFNEQMQQSSVPLFSARPNLVPDEFVSHRLPCRYAAQNTIFAK